MITSTPLPTPTPMYTGVKSFPSVTASLTTNKCKLHEFEVAQSASN